MLSNNARAGFGEGGEFEKYIIRLTAKIIRLAKEVAEEIIELVDDEDSRDGLAKIISYEWENPNRTNRYLVVGELDDTEQPDVIAFAITHQYRYSGAESQETLVIPFYVWYTFEHELLYEEHIVLTTRMRIQRFTAQ